MLYYSMIKAIGELYIQTEYICICDPHLCMHICSFYSTLNEQTVNHIKHQCFIVIHQTYSLVFCRKDLCEVRPKTPSVFKFSDVLFALKSDGSPSRGI